MALDVKLFVERFVLEARDNLRRVEDGFAVLDADPNSRDSVGAILRSIHTVKGSARMLKFYPISDIAHSIEDVFGAVREGKLGYSPDLGRLLQYAIDTIATQVDQVAEDEKLDPPDEELLRDLRQAAGQSASKEGAAANSSAEKAGSAGAKIGQGRLKAPETVRVQLGKLDKLIKLMGEVVTSSDRLTQRLADIRERQQEDGADPTLLLDSLMRNLKDDIAMQRVVMSELHSEALIMRMLPLSILFEPAARMIRGLARSMGKDVECIVKGMDIELDRQLIDGLSAPLVHLLRNAVDHGIEEQAVREKAGKPKHGSIRLEARQDGGAVIIEVADDGGGLSLSKIRNKAVARGMITADQAASLSEAETVDLIFLEGFSTSTDVTDVSGRGVGMDVVKRNISDLQGVISVETGEGKGTSFALHVPISFAVMRIFLVGVGKNVFGFTAQYVDQLLMLPQSRVVTVAERRAVIMDGELIPVVDLAHLMNLPSSDNADDEELTAIMIRVRNDRLILRVDRLIDEYDMVLRPLPDHLDYLPLLIGMVMTGKGTLVSVLHCPAIMDKTSRDYSADMPAATKKAPGEALRVLVVDDSINTREIVRDALEGHGYQVVLAEDGSDGLRKAKAGMFDAIVTDVEMPHMDGLALTAALRAMEKYRNLPIVILSARQKEEDKRRGLQVGASAYIVKGDADQRSTVDILRKLLG